MSTTSNNQAHNPQNQALSVPHLQPIPLDKEQQLKSLDKGKLLARLVHIRNNCFFIPPAEMYLLINPVEVYNIAISYYTGPARFIEKCRNIFVLFPLLLTWLGLSIASVAYSQTLVTHPQLIAQPFLKLWSDGFPLVTELPFGPLQLPSSIVRFFSFFDVATIDACLFLLLILLTWLAQIIESHAQTRAGALTSWLQEELFSLERQSWVIRSQGSERDMSLDRISSLMAEMQKVVASFNSIFQQQADGVTELIKGATRIATAADRLDIIFGRGQEVYDKLDATLPALEQQFGSMSKTQGQAAAALQSIADEIHNTSTSIEQLARPFAAEKDLGSIARKVGAQQKQALQDFSTVLQKQEDIAIQMNNVSRRMTTMPAPSQTQGGLSKAITSVKSIFFGKKDN